ncbi:MAG: phospholipase A [Spirochaetaceae bacterium]|jgi:phospholipase A1|nr:phospholipase A [Spirochaetaceae bacterium]
MRYILVIFLLFTGFFILSAEDVELQDAFSSYQPIYFVIGMGDYVKTRILDESSNVGESLETRQWVKLSYSMKYQFFYQYNTGLFLGFTQTMFWDIFNESSPLSELNYNPDFFWRLQSGYNFLQNTDTGIFDYLQMGVEHKSNGLAGTESRGYDRAYGQLQLKVGDTFSLALNAKYFMFYQDFMPDWYISEIDDLAEYRSNWEFCLQVHLNTKWAFFIPNYVILEVGPGGGFNQFDFSKGYQQIHIVFGDVFGGVHPYLQLWNGYGEGLINYDETTLSIRAGIMLR